MYRYAVIDQITNRVDNVIIWDGEAPWFPPKGYYAVRNDRVDVGDVYDLKSGLFSRPTQSDIVEPV